MKIWGRLKGREPEVVDECSKKEVSYLLGEYRMAFGKDWVLWAGLKREEPRDGEQSMGRR